MEYTRHVAKTFADLIVSGGSVHTTGGYAEMQFVTLLFLQVSHVCVD